MNTGRPHGVPRTILPENGYLGSLDPVVRQEIFSKAALVSDELKLWAAPYSTIRTVRTFPLALSVAAAAPFATPSELLDTARVSLWVFTLDDLFDEELFAPSEIVQKATLYGEIARSETVGPQSDPLAIALADVRNHLLEYPLFPSLGGIWGEAVSRTIAAMTREQEWRNAWRSDGPASLPGYDEYVENGLNSIGGPPHIWTAMITTDDHSMLDQLDVFAEMERTASTCVRLANDLQSEVKEIEESSPNSLIILSQALRQRGVEPPEARTRSREWVEEAIGRELVKLESLCDRARTQTGRPEAVAYNIAHFVCEFYRKHDYHTFHDISDVYSGAPSEN